MKKNYIKIGVLLFMLFSVQVGTTQDSIQLINLETVLKLGGANNLTIQKYKQKQTLAYANLSKAREWWLPDFYAGTTINQLWGAAMNGNGLFFQDVNSQNFWTGLGVSGSWNFAEGMFSTKAKKLKARAHQYLTAAEKNKVLLQSIEAYYDYLCAQLYYMAYEQLLIQNDTIIQQIKLQVTAGLRYESELLIAKSNRNHLKVERLNASMEQKEKAAALIHILNIPPDTKLFSSDSLLVPIELDKEIENQQIDDSVFINRPEFTAANLILQSLEMENKISTTALWLPELKFGIYGSMFGDVFTPLYPTSGLNFSLIWKLPMGNITYNGDQKIYNAKIDLHKTEVDELRAIVNEEYIRSQGIMETARVQMKIALEGKNLAEKALKQCLQRQELGTVLPFEILQVQEVYIKARLDYLNSVSKYNKAQYQLYVALGNDL
ncbi:MAG: TolC family protein [Saprospiraceae bacterium]|nr:TolC family protein [Saprospiraceae bacterium]